MPRLLPRKRTILGGTLAMGLIAGIYLSGKLPHMGSGFGLGTGGDSVIGQPDASQVAVKDGDVAQVSASSEDDPGEHDSIAKSIKPLRTEEAPPDDLLTILVEDRHYSVWRKTRKASGYVPAELDDLVRLALKTPPNDDGLRVRILRSKSARVTAWKSLQTELVKAGVPAESIVLPKELVE